MEILQYIYGRESREGWGPIYRSEELTRVRGFENILAGKISLAPEAPAAAVKFKFFFIEGVKKRWILAHSLPGGLDSGGRPGAYFNHCLVGEDFQNEMDCLPAELWGWPGWITKADQGLLPPALNAPFEPSRKPVPEDFLAALRRPKPPDLLWLAAMIDDFLAYALEKRSHQRLFITGQTSAQVAAWVGLLSFCLPERLVQEKLTFSTYEEEEDEELWLLSGLPDSRGKNRPELDLTKRCDRSGSFGRWARFCLQCLRNENGLEPEAVALGKMFYAPLTEEIGISDPLGECAEIVHWLYLDRPLERSGRAGLPPILKRIEKARRSDQIKLLVKLQELNWPPLPSPRKDGIGYRGRSSAGWLQSAQKRINQTGEAVRDLRRSYLSLLRNYWVGAGYRDHIQHLDVHLLTREEKKSIFKIFERILTDAPMTPFFTGIETCLNLGFEEELVKILHSEESRRNIRDLSDNPGYTANFAGLRSAKVKDALEKALQGPDEPAEEIMGSEKRAEPGARREKKSAERLRFAAFDSVADEAPLYKDQSDQLGFEILEDPRFLHRLAKGHDVTPDSSTGKKNELRQALWDFAAAQLKKETEPSAKRLFEIYFWTLWQAQQGSRLLGESEFDKILEAVLERLHHRGDRHLVLRMLREAFESPSRRGEPAASRFRKLFDLSWREKLLYRWLNLF